MNQLTENIIKWTGSKKKRIIIGISGHGAAGKTTFAAKLLDALNKEDANYLNTDPYIISSDVRRHAKIDYSYGNENHCFKMTACHPAAHHLPSLERDVQMIRQGLDFLTIDAPYSKSMLIDSKKRLSIVEGMAVAFMNPELYDLNIYFYTDDETELARRMNRDVLERGTDKEYLRFSHNQRRIQYKLFMHPYSERFDIIIKSSDRGEHIEKNCFAFEK
ncbi:uridine kinase family protein [Metabacillus indicus]|uniref:Phosphoribulokinase n=1 Tax=Metabacillus indicus TaxID=246786 RepID=A0A084GW29_METID|nr:phosphoribulokinase [Metabacillus indicus]KEZ51541.1 phosphoribulokinase [Metabacillus indicus]